MNALTVAALAITMAILTTCDNDEFFAIVTIVLIGVSAIMLIFRV